nr:72 kDa type IV collagenase-like [Lepeophtheirus salmonis]
MGKNIFFYSLSLILAIQAVLSAGQSCPTTDGRNCLFPFKYIGIEYDGCTTVDYGTTAWCATSVDSITGATIEYGDCTSSCKMASTASTNGCKSTSGVACKFPFGYNGEMFTQCTNADFGDTFWCAVSVNGNGDVQGYGTCSADCPRYSTISADKCATISGVSCTFPFKYNGKTYDACTTADNSGSPWCATSVNAQGEYQGYGNCNTNCQGKMSF